VFSIRKAFKLKKKVSVIIISVFSFLIFCCSDSCTDFTKESKKGIKQITDALQAHGEANKAFAKAKLKDAQSFQNWAEFEKIRLQCPPEQYFDSFFHKKIMKITDIMIKTDSELVEAYYEAAVAYDRAVEKYLKLCDDDGNPAEEIKAVELYSKAAKSYVEAAKERLEFTREYKFYCSMQRNLILKKSLGAPDKKPYKFDECAMRARVLDFQVRAINEEVKADEIYVRSLLGFIRNLEGCKEKSK
jgi:hypothetical protein